MPTYLQSLILSALDIDGGNPVTARRVHQVLAGIMPKPPDVHHVRTILDRLTEKGHAKRVETEPRAWKRAAQSAPNS